LEAIYFQVWQSADTPLGIDREFSGYSVPVGGFVAIRYKFGSMHTS